MTSLVHKASKMGMCTHLSSPLMTQTRSSSWTAFEAPLYLSRSTNSLPVYDGPGGQICTQTKSPTRLHDKALTSAKPLYGYSLLCCITTPGVPHTPCSFLFFSSTHFFPGRVAFRTLGLFSCKLIVFFFVMREVQSRCIHRYPHLLAFPCPICAIP